MQEGVSESARGEGSSVRFHERGMDHSLDDDTRTDRIYMRGDSLLTLLLLPHFSVFGMIPYFYCLYGNLDFFPRGFSFSIFYLPT